MENNKKGNGLVIFLIILMIVFASLTILLGTGVLKSPFVKCEECKDTTTVVEDNNKKTEFMSSDERYKEYIANLAKNIKEKSSFDANTIEGQFSGYTNDVYNNNYYNNGDETDYYNISITKDLELIINYGDSTFKEYKIADNVVTYSRIHTGNGGMSSLYFITTDGKVHSVNIEASIYGGKAVSIADLDKKNIIEIKQGSTSAGFPVFIDIDGNVTFGNAQ